ncbi:MULTISPECIES: hypothetical protein [Sphingomonas]|uniref:hypothetical protein n=1 Tax=Sphingomonas TaxID=13687 RepID=UPI001AEE67F6|nr:MULTISPECIES: hypothetical protein [Sphingomonas]
MAILKSVPWLETLSAIAALASAVAAIGAWKTANDTKPLPFDSSLYSARLASIEEYAEASARFQSALERAGVAASWIADGKPVTQWSDSQFEAAAVPARQMWQQWADYIAITSKTQALFSKNVMRAVQNSEIAGRAAYACFRWLGAPVPIGRLKVYRQLVRANAQHDCEHVGETYLETSFDTAARLQLRMMTDELREPYGQFTPGRKHDALD